MILYIKNMVCDRCIATVNFQLAQLGITGSKVKLGEVRLNEDLNILLIKTLDKNLKSCGFEILIDRKRKIIEKIKNAVIYIVHTSKEELKVNYSIFLENELKMDYKYLSNLFSEIENITIEKYIILQKIERVKELLVYNEMTLSQISDSLGYSNVSYLSNQFKKITGFTPSYYKTVKDKKRTALDKVKSVNII
jgi:YesN/AraC family two-component response regulator